MGRISKDSYYLRIARSVLRRGTCIRRNFGAVIVKDDRIVSTGYTGSPRGTINCIDTGVCPRNEIGAKPGCNYELCRSVHAEQNAIINGDPLDMNGATMYLVCYQRIGWFRPCKTCRSMIVNAKIGEVICPDDRGRPTIVYCNDSWFSKEGRTLKDFMEIDEGCGY